MGNAGVDPENRSGVGKKTRKKMSWERKSIWLRIGKKNELRNRRKVPNSQTVLNITDTAQLEIKASTKHSPEKQDVSCISNIT